MFFSLKSSISSMFLGKIPNLFREETTKITPTSRAGGRDMDFAWAAWPEVPVALLRPSCKTMENNALWMGKSW